MPRKPADKVIEASKKKLNPHDVLTAVLNECPESLKEELVARGLAKKVKED